MALCVTCNQYYTAATLVKPCIYELCNGDHKTSTNEIYNHGGLCIHGTSPLKQGMILITQFLVIFGITDITAAVATIASTTNIVV